MLRRVLVLLLSPVAALVAQTTPIRITITASNNGAFRVLRSGDSPTQARLGRGTWEMMTDSSTTTDSSEVVAVLAQDSLNRVHVEAREGSRVVASGDGAFVTLRRDAGVVFIESRSRAPSSFGAASFRRP
jgi:hypothetical protein